MKIASDRIERLHVVDLDVVHNPDENGLNEACAELTAGLLVQHSVLVEVGLGSGWPVVRFIGPRSQLEALMSRYRGDESTFVLLDPISS